MISDTDPAVACLIVEGYRKMSPDRRLLMACEMTTAVNELLLAGLRERHPDADDEELMRRSAEIRLGAELAAAAWAVRQSRQRPLR